MKLETPVLSAIAVCLAALAPAVEPFSVVSYNLRGDFDGGAATDKPDGWLQKSGQHRRELVLRVVREADPDLLGVQEAYANQVRELDDALPGHDAYGVGRDDGGAAGEQCAVFYRRDRFERLDAGTFWLSETPDTPSTHPDAACPRVASWLVLRDKAADRAGELLVVNTHWDHVGEAARWHAAALIAERLPGLVDGRPAVVLGDLNTTEETAPLRLLIEGAGLTDSYRAVHAARSPDERTFHGFNGGTEGSRIDFILTTAGLRATEASIERPAYDGRQPSDHYPVHAVIERGAPPR